MLLIKKNKQAKKKPYTYINIFMLVNMNTGQPWLMDLISMVLGILSSGPGCTDLRLTLDLNRVFIRVDFPRPLCPDQENTDTASFRFSFYLSEYWRGLIMPMTCVCVGHLQIQIAKLDTHAHTHKWPSGTNFPKTFWTIHTILWTLW